jgi:hypothetical protein
MNEIFEKYEKEYLENKENVLSGRCSIFSFNEADKAIRYRLNEEMKEYERMHNIREKDLKVL